jgi:hypothetical protein
MLTGSLKTFSCTNLMQMCDTDNTTGTIEFTKDGISYGNLGFNKGTLTHAQFTTTVGIEAAKQLTLLQDLDFNLTTDIQKTKPNIKTDITFLLLEVTRYMDECTEYLDQIKPLFENKFSLRKIQFYQYEHTHFAFPDVYPIKYFEVYDQTQMIVIYYAEKINCMIKVLFADKILTSDLLKFMKGKGIF